MIPMELRTKNHHIGEDWQQFTQPGHQDHRYVQLDKEKPCIYIKLGISHTYGHSDV
jgi:hypothetical protein